MINALLNKVFFQLRIIYDNFLKLSKTLKEIKAYFICVNNRHKMTRKTCEKEKIQKIDRTIHLYISKRFVSFFFRLTYTFSFSFFLIISSTIISKKMLTKIFISIIISKIILQ